MPMPNPSNLPDQQTISRLTSTRKTLNAAVIDRIHAIDKLLAIGNRFIIAQGEKVKSILATSDIIDQTVDLYGEDFCSRLNMSKDCLTAAVCEVKDALKSRIHEVEASESKHHAAMAKRYEERNRLSDLFKFLEANQSSDLNGDKQ